MMPSPKTVLTLSQYVTLPLLQPPTVVMEDIGKLTDFAQQLAVCDLHRIPWFIPFPGKTRRSLLLCKHYKGTVQIQRYCPHGQH